MALQRLPHALLERGAADVERQVQALTRRLDEADDLGHHVLEFGVAALKLGVRKAVLQVAHQRMRDRRRAGSRTRPCRGGDQHRAERGLPDGEADDAPAPPRGPRPASCRAARPCSRRSGSRN